MDIKRVLAILWKWSWLILLAVVVSGGASYWSSMQMPRIYQTSTSLMVGQFFQSSNPRDQDFRVSAGLAKNYARQATTPAVLGATIESLELDSDWRVLEEQVNAYSDDQSVIIDVIGTDPMWVQLIADELARQLILHSPTVPDEEEAEHRTFVSQQLTDLQLKIEQGEEALAEMENQLADESSARAIQELQASIAAQQQKISTWQTNYTELLDFYSGSRTNYLTVVQPAALPTTPISPATTRNVLLAALVGLVLAALGAFLIEFLDDTIKNPQDVERVLALPTLGQIGRLPKKTQPADRLVVLKEPQGRVAESYRSLRTNLHFTTVDQPVNTLFVTSAVPGEGKTVTAANLAAIIAQADKKVILVDADLRQPSLHRLFDVSLAPGLTDLLLDEGEPIESVLVSTPIPNLKLLPSGPLPPNPAELMASEVFSRRLEQLKKHADMILFDSSPVLAVADPAILGAICDGVILVVDTRRTRSEMVRQAQDALTRVGVRLVGAVLNKAHPNEIYQTYYFSEIQKEPRIKNKLLPAGNHPGAGGSAEAK